MLKLELPMKTTQMRTFQAIGLFLLSVSIATGLRSRASTNDTNQSRALSEAQRGYDQALAKVGKANEWKDPDKVASQVVYENLPVTEVVANLKELFNNEFDVLLPFGSQDTRWSEVSIALRLKNVKASEIFNAMNLVFESAKTPLRWELIMNGHRPTALLRDLHEPISTVDIDPTTGLPRSPKPAPVERPMVFFVGDLVGDPKIGGMTMEEIVQTVSDVCKFALAGEHISSHKQAQLLIVRGTEEDIAFVQNTLVALREKARLDAQRRGRTQPGEAKPKSSETTSP